MMMLALVGGGCAILGFVVAWVARGVIQSAETAVGITGGRNPEAAYHTGYDAGLNAGRAEARAEEAARRSAIAQQVVDKCHAPTDREATAIFKRSHRDYPASWVVVSIAALRVMRRYA